jgi:hypothetical protein
MVGPLTLEVDHIGFTTAAGSVFQKFQVAGFQFNKLAFDRVEIMLYGGHSVEISDGYLKYQMMGESWISSYAIKLRSSPGHLAG